MINYILIGLGTIFAIIGILLFIKRFGYDSTSKVRFLGLEIETKSSSLIIFTVGVALVAFGAAIKHENVNPGNKTETSETINEKDTSRAISDSDTSTDKDASPIPFKEFTLSADQKHVMNDLKITLTMPTQELNTQSNSIQIRIWRNIQKPISDTAILDPSSSEPGVEIQVFRLNAITPISITDVGQFKFIISNAIMSGSKVASVQVKMYKTNNTD